MNEYEVSIRLPVRAVTDRAAHEAQLEIYHQLQLVLSRGIRTDDFEVDPVTSEQFTTKTSVVKV